MAADGSLKFDTKIDTDGVNDGISTLTDAVKRLSGVMEQLATQMEKGFFSAGSAAEKTAKDIDEITESTRAAREEAERLRKEKAATFTGTIEDHRQSDEIPEREGNYNLYGQDVDELIAKNKALEESAREASAAVQEEVEKEGESLVGLKESMGLAVEAIKDMPNIISAIFSKAGESMDSVSKKTRNLQDEVDRYADALYYAESKGYDLGDKPYDEAYIGLQKAKKAADEYKKELVGVDGNQKKAEKSSKGLNHSMKDMKKTVPPLAKSILKLSSMFKLMMIRMAMRAVIQSAREGFQNLAQYSEDTNKSLSMLMSAMTRLKNSFATAFAPILNVAAPALKHLIDLLSQGAALAAQFLAALTGKSTFVKAVDVEEDYGAALKENNEALKDRDKEVKKLTFSFDDLIQVQKDSQAADDQKYQPPTPDQMFKTVTVENDIKTFADKVKGILSRLFDPLKKSWLENGSYVTGAIKEAFASLKTLAGDVGVSFMQVWDTEGYGKRISDDLLKTFGNIVMTVKNLADRFDEAWKSGDAGTNILRHLGDVILVVTGFFRDASESIRDWAAKLDFGPLLRSFDGLLIKIRPIIQKVGGILLWLLDSVLLPIAKWAIEDVIPAAFDLFGAALDALNSIIDALTPLARWLWDSFLKPLGQWTGKVIIEALKGLAKGLTKFSDWIKDHQEAVQVAATVVGAFFAAWAFVEFANGVDSMLTKLPLLIGSIGNLLSNLNPTVIVLGSIITIAALVAEAWDKMTPGEQLATKILAVAGAIGILVYGIGALLKNPVMMGIGLSVAFLAGIGLVGVSLNALNRGSAGGKARSFLSEGKALSMQAIPRLATGTVVPPRAGEFAAILGDNNRDAEIVSPVPAMKQAFKEAMQEMGGIGGGHEGTAYLVLDGTKFGQIVYKYNKNEERRIGVRMVTEG